MTRAIAILLAATVLVAACGSSSDDDSTPLVVVPNDVLADLVSRVACVDPVEVMIGEVDPSRPPVLVVSLDEAVDSAGVLTVSVPAVATTIDRPGPDDAWVWLDPIRFAEVARGVGAALTLTDDFDADLIDRCLARVDSEMQQLDEELFAATQALPVEQRSIDVSAPGVAYFASRYEFLTDESATAVRAGRIISSDGLDGAESYDEMMRVHVEQATALLSSG